MTDILKLMPLAIVMIAGPQIISAILLATSERAKKDSLAFVAGAILAAAVGTSVAFAIFSTIGSSASIGGGGNTVMDWIFAVLLALVAVRVFLKRKTTKPPKWMDKLETATPKFAFRLGFLLFIAMPTDILTEVTVGGYLAAHGHSLVGALPFLALTALLIGLPLLILLLLGKRAEVLLPKMRDWMHDNSWIVSEVVLVLFILMEVSNALSS